MAKKTKSATSANMTGPTGVDTPACGIVMPISAIDGCSEQHWLEVRQVLVDAIEDAGFSARLVSDADEVGVIQKRIVKNLYDNPIVVCDVSGKNPNVMFEMGLRLAFDKPTIIVKDDRTPFSFDTAPIEHLEYPRSLHYQSIVNFKENLAGKLKNTHKAATSDPDYTTFLGHFGTFHVAQLDETVVSPDQLILEELGEIKHRLNAVAHTPIARRIRAPNMDTRLLTDIGRCLRSYRRERGIRGKKAMESHRRTAADFVEKEIAAPQHFGSQGEYMEYFNAVFDLLYS